MRGKPEFLLRRYNTQGMDPHVGNLLLYDLETITANTASLMPCERCLRPHRRINLCDNCDGHELGG